MNERSPHQLHLISITIGAIMIVGAVLSFLLLGIWALVGILPTTCLCASWLIYLFAGKWRIAHLLAAGMSGVIAMVWLWNVLRKFPDRSILWLGIFFLWLIVMAQLCLFLPQQRARTIGD